MARVRGTPEAEQAIAAASVMQFAQKAAKRLERRRERGFSASKVAIEKVRDEMDDFAESGEWAGARGSHLIALYAWMHEQVYGAAPIELVGKEYAAASSMAKRVMVDWFEGDPNKVVEFLKWCWLREKARMERRAQVGQASDFRIGWRLQFGRAFISDYRVAMAQAAKGTR